METTCYFRKYSLINIHTFSRKVENKKYMKIYDSERKIHAVKHNFKEQELS